MRHSKLFYLLIILLSTTAAAIADTVEWSSAAMACTPTSRTVAEGKYVTTAGRVKFRKGKTGSISFVCPITQKLKRGSYILKGHTTYAGGGNGQTLIALRRSKKDGYGVTNVVNADIYFAAPPNKHRSQSGGNKNLVFDTAKFYYWVQLTIKKSDSNGERAIHGVELIRQ